MVNWYDFAVLQETLWAAGPPFDVAGFAEQWLKTGTVLPGEGDKPMTAAQLVEGKRADAWASFFPRSQARGGGLSESKPAGGGLRDDASGTEMLESVLVG